jgi:hypothetical protein
VSIEPQCERSAEPSNVDDDDVLLPGPKPRSIEGAPPPHANQDIETRIGPQHAGSLR